MRQLAWTCSFVALALTVLSGQRATTTPPASAPADPVMTIETARGAIEIRLFRAESPKSVAQIEFQDVDGRRRCRLVMDGRHVLTFSVARGGRRALPDASMMTYTYVDGVLHRTPFVSGATGVGIHLGGAELVLGDHPLAGELGSLGLPKGALMSVWMEHSHGRFEAPAPC